MKRGNISLFAAILLNLNVILGGGFFLAAQENKVLGIFLSCAMWLFGALLFLPLAKIFSDLSIRFPVVGGLYAYPKEAFGRGLAVATAVLFFVSVSLGNSALVRYFALECFKVFPLTNSFMVVNKITLVSLTIILAWLSIQGNKVLLFIEEFVSVAKVVGVIVVLAIGIAFFGAKPAVFISANSGFEAFKGSLLYIVFAYVGIEACCAIANQVENIGLVTYLSLLIAGCFYVVLQAAVCLIDINLGSQAQLTFLSIKGLANLGFLLAVITSYFGSLYGGILANNWNLYAVVKDLQIFHFNDRLLLYLCASIQATLMIFGVLFLPNVLAYGIFVTTIVYAIVLAAYAKLFWSKKPWLTVGCAGITVLLMGVSCFL